MYLVRPDLTGFGGGPYLHCDDDDDDDGCSDADDETHEPDRNQHPIFNEPRDAHR